MRGFHLRQMSLYLRVARKYVEHTGFSFEKCVGLQNAPSIVRTLQIGLDMRNIIRIQVTRGEGTLIQRMQYAYYCKNILHILSKNAVFL